MTRTTTLAVDVLAHARLHLVERGWTRDPLNREDSTKICVQLALGNGRGDFAKTVDFEGYYTACEAIEAALLATRAPDCRCTRKGMGRVAWHNDHCLRDEADALDWMARALRHLKESA